MFVNPQQVVEEFNEHTQQSKHNVLAYLGLPGSTVTLTAEAVELAIQHIKDSYDRHRMSKGTRPWSIVDVTRHLDQNQPWIGMEYETGWDARGDYQRVVDWLWDNVSNNTMDHEGCGEYYAELTFAPCNLSDFNANASDMDSLLAFTHRNGIRAAADDAHTVGIHVNYSTPAFRALTPEQSTVATNLMNKALRTLSTQHKSDLFGRQPYGYLYRQSFIRPNGQTMQWIEGKLFRTTDNVAQWQRYKYVVNRLINLMDATSSYVTENWETIRTRGEIRVYSQRDISRARQNNIPSKQYHRYFTPVAALRAAIIENAYLFLNGNTDAVEFTTAEEFIEKNRADIEAGRINIRN